MNECKYVCVHKHVSVSDKIHVPDFLWVTLSKKTILAYAQL
jgi:hypothetical protein